MRWVVMLHLNWREMNTINFTSILLVLSAILIGCQSNIGPCIHNYEDPILTIQSVYSAENGDEINIVKISDVKIDNVSRALSSFDNDVSNNIVVDDSLLICTIPCGFGIEVGTYEISFSADGYRDSTISTTAKYNKSKGGCPSSSSDGTKRSFSLSPQ